MKYFILLMTLVLSSCSHDIQVNDGDERISIFKHNRIIKFVGHQGEYNIGDSIKIVKIK